MKWLYAIVILSLFLVACSSDPTGNLVRKTEVVEEVTYEKYVTPSELQGIVKGIKIIDIRENWKFTESHIPNSVGIPMSDLDKIRMQAEGIGKDDRIVIYDETGQRSESAYNVLTRSGFENVQILEGGYNAWIAKEYTVEASY